MASVYSKYSLLAPPKEVGESIPANTPHAVSMTLPTWEANVAYEEGEAWVYSKIKSAYPRYFCPCVSN
jgi:cystathionine gamma-synthase